MSLPAGRNGGILCGLRGHNKPPVIVVPPWIVGPFVRNILNRNSEMSESLKLVLFDIEMGFDLRLFFCYQAWRFLYHDQLR